MSAAAKAADNLSVAEHATLYLTAVVRLVREGQLTSDVAFDVARDSLMQRAGIDREAATSALRQAIAAQLPEHSRRAAANRSEK